MFAPCQVTALSHVHQKEDKKRSELNDFLQKQLEKSMTASLSRFSLKDIKIMIIE